jgi:small-conductance mechanosensitive channel/CRP-like cAMP-binding protein
MILIGIAIALFILSLALWKPYPRSRGRFRGALIFLVLWGVAQALPYSFSGYVALAFLELAALELAAGAALGLALNRVSLPRFKVEIFVVAGYVAILVQLLYRLGVNVTGIFATSAVATAVIGLALQDLLSNVAGGLALEFEREITAGDYIRCSDATGWVEHVRLRHSSILTPDGDRVILPNSFLVRSAVTIHSKAHRRFVPFTMPYMHDPEAVMGAVTKALRASPTKGVATEPAPSCVIRELAAGHVAYAAVVWLTEPDREIVIVSEVLNRVWFALRRAGSPVSEISTLVEIKNPEASPSDSTEHALKVLRGTPIFRLLDHASLAELAAQLRPLSFAPGEFIMREEEPGDSMYFVTAGEAAITLAGDSRVERQVAVISTGDFFGEASLATGAVRNASAVAINRLDCYQLDKAGLQGLMTRLPELAEDMSVLIVHRQMELDGVRHQLDRETARRRESESQTQLLRRIRRFFSLDA